MKLLSHRFLSLLSLAVTAGFLFSCARTMNPDIERGSNFKFQEGYPEARANAVGFINEEGEPGISVAVDVVYGSLVYKNTEDNALRGEFAIDIQVIEAEGLKRTVSSERYTQEVTSNSKSISYNQEVLNYEKRIPTGPGTYNVNITVTDLNSNKQITRVSETTIPDPANDSIDLTNIRLFGKDLHEENPSWIPITTYDIPGRVDSLKFVFQVVNSPSGQPINIDTRLIRFRADTQWAKPMYHNNYGPSSLLYKGIETDEYEVVQTSQREFEQAGSVLIELKFPLQERGNYRFEASTSRGADEEIFKGRAYGIKSENYPAVQTPRELARPLIYLMEDDEYEELLSITNSDTLKAAIDRFWLRNIQNSPKAKNVIRMYYERVEEANKQFSNYKEGWKTDRGMIYILFGPPWYVENNLDRRLWSFSYNRNDPDYNFLFIQRKLKTEYYPFENYVLQRSNYYYDTHYQQKQLWLTGQILTRSI